MFLHLCVILYRGGGGSALDADPPELGRLPWMQTPLGLGRPPQGWADPMGLGRTPLDADPQRLRRPPDTVNKRAVRILLECILVQKLVRINERISQPFTFVISTI